MWILYEPDVQVVAHSEFVSKQAKNPGYGTGSFAVNPFRFIFSYAKNFETLLDL
jgi:hypothetical protein